MSKVIKLTPEIIEQCRTEFKQSLEKAAQEFEEHLAQNKIAGGKINFSFGNYVKSFEQKDRKAELYFTEAAWLKMSALVSEFSTEVAWHGVAFRDEDDAKDAYYITDVIVYPQKVSGGNVETDQEEYQTWLYSLSDDQFNNLRMQGHSHVNMGVTPSGVDLTQQGKILEQMHGDMFYIFLIWNKSNQKTIKIYDLKKNVLFETEDVEVKVLDDLIGLKQFVESAKAVCKTYSYNKSGNYAGQYNKGGAYAKSETKQETKPETKQETKKETEKETRKESKSPSKKVNPFTDGYSFRSSGRSIYDDDDYDNYYGSEVNFEALVRDPFGVYDGPHYNYNGGRW